MVAHPVPEEVPEASVTAKETWAKIDAITNKVVARTSTGEMIPGIDRQIVAWYALMLAMEYLRLKWQQREDALVWGE